MKTIKIALSGPHNSGKTTALYYISYKMKSTGNIIGIGHEVARDCPYPIGLESTDISQLWMLYNHMLMEKRL